MEEQKKFAAWGWIIFWMVFFFPVGFVLMYLRFKRDVKGARRNANISLVIGAFLMFYTALAFVTYYDDYLDSGNSSSNLLGVIIMFVISMLFINMTIRLKKEAKLVAQTARVGGRGQEMAGENTPELPRERTLTCPNCGASTTLMSNETGVCDYCGTLLK